MAQIVLNPDTGAAIKDYTVLGITPFTEANPFQPGTLFQFEDEKVAEAFLNHFGFLEVMTAEDAKKFLEMKKLECDKCDFKTRVQSELTRHIEMHAKEQELSDLGIPILKKKQTNEELTKSVADLQKQIDSQDAADGLEGAGLIDDKPQKTVIMS
jgi:hypothetical protein